MINLKIDFYCDDCPDFKPKIEKDVTRLVSEDLSIFINPLVKEKVVTTVTCKFAKSCKQLRTHLEGGIKND